MITIGFLVGALAAVLDQEGVLWYSFLSALVVGLIGVIVVRVAHRKVGTAEVKIATDMQVVRSSLGQIVENITTLSEQKHSLNTYDVRHRIDELFAADVTAFVEARESIAHVHGLNAYADVMSSFAAGERYLNRVWSASADGYVDEVNAYLDSAREQFAESLEKVRLLGAEVAVRS